MNNKFDLIVLGSGHAGIEAAWAAIKLDLKVALISYSKSDIGSLHCNVSIGGTAKGIVVKEMSIFNALMPEAADNTQLQTKILNKSKGYAVQSLRTRVDKLGYPKFMKEKILNSEIKFIEDEVINLLIKNKKLEGVYTRNNGEILSNSVVISSGTFLSAKVMKGKNIIISGPDDKQTNKTISEQLREFGHRTTRLKTGTPPRILTSSINFTNLKEELGEDDIISFTNKKYNGGSKEYRNDPAFLTWTNKETHKIINNNIKSSYLYSEEIKGAGPRYCPSIEDKVKRFSTKEKHQIFLESESLDMNSTYLTGLSSSMPKEVQEKFLRTIEGLENCEILKYAYAIEYDAIDSTQLYETLESRLISNLYFAGQVNGTSGYEEAAAQGMVAGINAANKFNNVNPLVFRRDESYIGVMIDDITSKKVIEPYRLLSSRAEYRLTLRNDNAERRLYKIAYNQKLISKEKFDKLTHKFSIVDSLKDKFKSIGFKTNDLRIKEIFEANDINEKQSNLAIDKFIKRPNFSLFMIYDYLKDNFEEIKELNDEHLKLLNIEIKYEGYINKQEKDILKYKRLYNLKIPTNINYEDIKNIAIEAREKLISNKPENIYKASKIQGVNSTDVLYLVHYINNIYKH